MGSTGGSFKWLEEVSGGVDRSIAVTGSTIDIWKTSDERTRGRGREDFQKNVSKHDESRRMAVTGADRCRWNGKQDNMVKRWTDFLFEDFNVVNKKMLI
jgi:hypothetical protein